MTKKNWDAGTLIAVIVFSGLMAVLVLMGIAEVVEAIVPW